MFIMPENVCVSFEGLLYKTTGPHTDKLSAILMQEDLR